MAIKPIIFSTEMVRAILDGRKSVTRRVIKKKHNNTDLVMRTDKYGTRLVERQNDAPPPAQIVYSDGKKGTQFSLIAIRDVPSPYRKGDVLWVRETYSKYDDDHIIDGIMYAYRADATPISEEYRKQFGYKWRSARYMPKAAARIFLRVKDVRAEKLQDITDDDAISEGANFKDGRNVGFDEKMSRTAIERFQTIWDSLNAKRGYGWETNPWVWVISFEWCEKPEGWV